MFKVSVFLADTVTQLLSALTDCSGGQYYDPMSSQPTTVQPFCEHGEPGHCLIETWSKVEILNDWLAKDVAAVACSGIRTIYLHTKINKNHLGTVFIG